MSPPYPSPVTAAQVGTYFVSQYYHLLQTQPELVYQFYNEASTMLRVDGTCRDNATTMLHIHALVMSLHFAGIEIRTAHSLESWNGGVLLMVFGSVQVKDLIGRRKFMETFFLAPQEKGFFVLNDVFHFIDEEPIHHHHHPAVLLARNNLDSKMNTPTAISEPVPNYLLGGEIQAREAVSPIEANENGAVDNYNFPEHPLQYVHEPENVRVETTFESNGSCQSTVSNGQDQLPVSVEEPTGEPQKHTYASILRVAKGQSAPSAAPQPSFNKNVPPASDYHTSQPLVQQSIASSQSFDRLGADMGEEISAVEDEDEIPSVYVRNLPTTVSETEIEEEFKSFGKIAPDGVVIRSRKDVGICYAFVEFEDMTGVHNAVKVGSAHVAGRQVYIEGRRPNSNIPSRVGRGRGRGRSSYPADASRGRFGGRSFGRSGSYEGGDQVYNNSRGNGYYRPTSCQDRASAGYQRSVENVSD